MSQQDEVLREFTRTSKSFMGEPAASYVDRRAMANELATLREQLQAVTQRLESAVATLNLANDNGTQWLRERDEARHRAEQAERERDVYASTCTELELKERELERENTELRTNALNIAFSYGQTDGGHHKMWVIDQMVRALLGNDMEYTEWVKEYCMDGEYEWDEGIAP